MLYAHPIQAAVAIMLEIRILEIPVRISLGDWILSLSFLQLFLYSPANIQDNAWITPRLPHSKI
jgi:hypothetical protein